MAQAAVAKEGMVRLALTEVGDVPAPALADFIQQRFGVKIEPRFIPLFRASLRAKGELEEARAMARAVLADKPAGGPCQAA
jgi:hypothetical protein